MTDVNECARFLGTDLGCQNGATCRNLPGTYRYYCNINNHLSIATRRKVVCFIYGYFNELAIDSGTADIF